MKKIITALMIGSTMLSVNAQGNPDNPLLKMDRSIRWVPAFNEYNISQIKPAFDVAIGTFKRD
jgi:peptidyl-dipeptidase Dcp